MKALFRILGTAAAVAATGAAIVVLDKILNDKTPLHVESVEFPEEAENDPAEAEKTAEAYAEGEAKAAAPAQPETPTPAASSAMPATEEAPAEPAAAPAAPTEGEEPAFDPDAPNLNPWRPAPPSLRKTKAASLTPLKLPTPPISAIGKNRGVRADFPAFLNKHREGSHPAQCVRREPSLFCLLKISLYRCGGRYCCRPVRR